MDEPGRAAGGDKEGGRYVGGSEQYGGGLGAEGEAAGQVAYSNMASNLEIKTGDCREVLKELSAGSVQCCVTSPPYDKLRTYGGYSWDFEAIALELYRVLCPGGVLCWNVGDSVVDGSETLTSLRQAIYFKDVCGFRVHDTMIYERLNFSAPESVRYHQAFEYVFVLTKGKPRTFNPIKDRKNVYGGQSAFGQNTKRQADGSFNKMSKSVYSEYGMRTNVWRGKTCGQENPCAEQIHPAAMPEWLARDLVLSWSDLGDVVLDPFGGSGTTGMVALELGRKAILIELNPDYVKLADDRCNVTPGLALK